MELKNFGYSLRNISLLSKSNYLKCMIEKADIFVKRLTLKAFYFCKEKHSLKNESHKLFGFKSPALPPQNELLHSFEIKLQKKENIRSSKNMLAFADKSTNLYEVSREHYEKPLHDNITQTYKIASPGARRKSGKESKQFPKHRIDDRIECYSDQNA